MYYFCKSIHTSHFMQLANGHKLQNGKYRIEQKIGQGGFGITYLARWYKETRGAMGTAKSFYTIVIKEFFWSRYCSRDTDGHTVNISLAEGKELMMQFKEKLKKEGKIIAKLSHPNIVSILDIFEENNTAYLVMQYVEGESLDAIIRTKGQIDEATALQYMDQICSALSEIHSKRILHLDIKPSNVLIDEDGQVQLIDFGISKQYDESAQETSDTPLGVSKGYSPMEQYSTLTSFSPPTDIYATGATLYKMLTGITPIEATARSQFDMEPVTYYCPDISKKTAATVTKAMNEKMRDRFQTAEEFRQALINDGRSGNRQTDNKTKDDKTKIDTPSKDPQKIIIDSTIIDKQPDSPVKNSALNQQSIPVPENFNRAAVSMAHNVNDYMSLNQAFETARQEVGPGGMFHWHGDIYGTYYTHEWQGFSEEYRQAFSSYLYSFPDLPAYDTFKPSNLELSEQKTQNIPIMKYLMIMVGTAVIVFLTVFGLKQLIDKRGNTTTLQTQSSVSNFSNYNETTNNLNIEMIAVQGGTFTMGCTSEQGDDCYDDEKPAHRVTVSDFYIGKYEVTQAQWRAVMGNNPSNFKGDNLPVEYVSWNDVQDFIRRLNASTGKQYRLPTEAEWEFAARGGNSSRGTRYSGSNTVGNVAWYYENAGDKILDDKTWGSDKLVSNNNKTHPVGTKSANELGIYDMSGNVWEWCNDWYGSYNSNTQTNPQGASLGSTRVFRGGSWGSHARYTRVSYRSSGAPDYRADSIGFRLACSSK